MELGAWVLAVGGEATYDGLNRRARRTSRDAGNASAPEHAQMIHIFLSRALLRVQLV